MKGLVLAGGTGTRLRPLSHAMPKQLVPVANRPVLLHGLDTLRAAGIRDVGVIVGDTAAEIRAAAGDGSALGLRLTYLRQRRPLGLAHAVRVARDYLGLDDFVMYLGDNVLSGGIGEAAQAFVETRPAAQVLLDKVEDPRQYGVAQLDADGRVLRLEEKSTDPPSDLALIGVYFFTAAVHEAVRCIRPSRRGEWEITHAIQWLVDAGQPVRGALYAGYWRDTGQVPDLLDCNRTLLNDVEPAVLGTVDAESVLRGRIRVEPGAWLVRTRVTGPVVIGAGAEVTDCEIGPGTAIGAGCVLTATAVENSILLPGATVERVTGLSDSVVGRGAALRGGPTTTGRHHVVVADDSLVDMAC